MTSSDREILIAIQSDIGDMRKDLAVIKVSLDEQGQKITRIESRLDEQDARMTRMEQRQEAQSVIISDIDKRVLALEGNFDTLKWGIGLGFGIIGALIGLSTLIITAIPFLRTKREETPATNPPAPDNTPAIIQSLIELMRFTRESERH